MSQQRTEKTTMQTLSAYAPNVVKIEQMRARYLDKREKLTATTGPEAQAMAAIIEVLGDDTRDLRAMFQRLQRRIDTYLATQQHYQAVGQFARVKMAQRRLAVMNEAQRELAPLAGYKQVQLKSCNPATATAWLLLQNIIPNETTGELESVFPHPRTQRPTLARRSLLQDVWFEIYDVDLRRQYSTLVEKTTGVFRDETTQYAKHIAYHEVMKALEQQSPSTRVDALIDDTMKRQDSYGASHKMYKFYQEKLNVLNVARADMAYIDVYKYER
jgi:hypothetical protein